MSVKVETVTTRTVHITVTEDVAVALIALLGKISRGSENFDGLYDDLYDEVGACGAHEYTVSASTYNPAAPYTVINISKD